MKTCTGCKETKPRTEFGKHSTSGDGLRPWCVPCCSAAARKYRAAEPENCRRADRTYRAAKRADDPLWERLARGRKRARKLGCPVESFTSADLLAYWSENGIAGDRCYYSGELLGDEYHLDHMTPLSRGGAHSVYNLVPCTRRANITKQDKTAAEFLALLPA